MEQGKDDREAIDWWLEKARVQERPFISNAPIIGGLIARFRAAWNSVSTKWYVQPILQQQNQFNRLVIQWLNDNDARLITQDREQTQLVRETAELTTQLIRMNRLLQSIDERLARLEAGRPQD